MTGPNKEQLEQMFAMGRAGATAGEELRWMVQKAVESVPAHIQRLIAENRVRFAPAFDGNGRLYEISIVPIED